MTSPDGLTRRQAATKRLFDVVIAAPGLALLSPLIVLAWVLATLDTRQNGLFRQARIGRGGVSFEVLKIRTMRGRGGSTVTAAGDPRMTRLGAMLRRLKIDELPQLLNVVRGEMSLVGPRPDVPGFADLLGGDDRIVLSVRPGITGPAAVAFRHEEALLAAVPDPEVYNSDVLWPAKVRLNREYVETWSLRADVHWLLVTLKSVVAAAPVEGSLP